jgi:hypothetical protein
LAVKEQLLLDFHSGSFKVDFDVTGDDGNFCGRFQRVPLNC